MPRIRISVPLYRRTLFEDGWKQQPMPADVLPPPDNEWRRWTELPPLARISDPRLSFDGWQQSPLPADNELSAAKLHDLVPRGLNRHTDTSYYQHPPIDSNDLSSALLHFTLPELGLRPLRFSYEGWTGAPLAGDNELSSFRELFEVPLRRDLNSYNGFTVSPPLADIEQPFSTTSFTFDVPLSRDRKPVADFSAAPLPPDNEASASNHEFEVPQFRDLNQYTGWQVAPTVADNDIASVRVVTDVPAGRNLLPNFGFSTPPLSGPFQEVSSWVFDLDVRARDFDPQGFQHTPGNRDAVETPVAGTTEYGVPLGRLPSRDFTFALAGAAPELQIQATMPTPFYTMPHFGPLPLDAYVGATSTPLSADAPVATDVAIWRPTMRPRRRS